MSCSASQREGCNGFSIINANSDIAGIGVVLSFVITTSLAIITATLLTIIEWHADSPYIMNSSKVTEAFRNMLRSISLALNDTQLVTGLAIMAAGFYNQCELSVYHYKLIGWMGLLCLVTYAATLGVLAGYFRKYRFTQGLLRMAGMCAMTGMWVIWSVRARNMSAGNTPYVAIQAACYISGNPAGTDFWMNGFDDSSAAFYPLIIGATVLVVLNIVLAMSRWLRAICDGTGRAFHGRSILYVIRLVFQGLGPIALAFWAIWQLYVSRNYPELVSEEVATNVTWTDPTMPPYGEKKGALIDGDQGAWEFGQIVPIAILMITAFAAFEALTEKRGEREGWEYRSYGRQNGFLRAIHYWDLQDEKLGNERQFMPVVEQIQQQGAANRMSGMSMLPLNTAGAQFSNTEVDYSTGPGVGGLRHTPDIPWMNQYPQNAYNGVNGEFEYAREGGNYGNGGY